jgi:glutamate racemase
MKSVRNLPIGIFDSGVGGLTVVRQMHRLLPHENLLYLGDTARVPYGTKSPETVVRFGCEDAQFLVDCRVKALVVACNTVSAWALPVLEKRFAVPVFGVILPGAGLALRRTKNHRIGVIGTNATVRSGAYTRAMTSVDRTVKVFARPCPLLVPLVEEGWVNHSVTLSVLHVYLEPLLRKGIDTLVLGCTHYPLLKRAIRTVVGDRVTLIDSAESCARFVRGKLKELGLTSSRSGDAGWIQPYVTDETARFEEIAGRFLSGPIKAARKAEVAGLAQSMR